MSRISHSRRALVWLLLLVAAVGLVWWRGRAVNETQSSRAYQASPRGTLTFNREIAPIIFQHCAECHRPGAPGPFSLLTFAEVAKRARQIADVTRRGVMPPWLPEPGHVQFLEERGLGADEFYRT